MTLGDRPQVILWLKRLPPISAYIEKMLKKNNVPEDLKYMAIAESALLPMPAQKRAQLDSGRFFQIQAAGMG